MYKINVIDKSIDQLLIKVSGKMFLGKKLALDDEVIVGLQGTVIREKVRSNQDGSVNSCYVRKAVEVQVQLNITKRWPTVGVPASIEHLCIPRHYLP